MVELCIVRPQVEIEVQFVAFDRSDINSLAREGMVNAKSLRQLWRQDKGQLLYAPRVITQSGVEAAAKGVKEIIYPTEFVMESDGGSNTKKTVTTIVPTEWVTREVGVIFVVLPEVSANNYTITLAIAPEIVEEPEWKTYTVEHTGAASVFTAEQPFFVARSVATTVRLYDGQTILIGGGMANTLEAKVVYTFVTARLIGLDGEPIRKKDKQ
jgi:type II secretory pathway component GspD/PulD (secretin)